MVANPALVENGGSDLVAASPVWQQEAQKLGSHYRARLHPVDFIRRPARS
jgi:hypothetical protein